MTARVERLALGPLAANCYLAWDDGAPAGSDGRRGCLVVDPGAEPEAIIAAMEEEKLRPDLIVATHCHGDHIGAVDSLLQAFPGTVFAAGAEEASWPSDPVRNLSYGFGISMRVANPGRLLRDGEEFEAGGLRFRALAVPGHSPGSMVYHCPGGGMLFSGDTLFALNIGRGDLPGGDEGVLVRAIREKIFPLPPATIVWPGHATRTRVGTEKKGNPYCGEAAG